MIEIEDAAEPAFSIAQKKHEELFSFLCVDDQAMTTKKKFAATLREAQRVGGTTLAEVGTEVDFLYENRRAGADKPEDLDKMTTVLVPIRLHTRTPVFAP
jgi:hypothetical protein